MNFNSHNEYDLILDFLYFFCDEVRIIEDEDSIFQSQIEKYARGYKWIKRFPGYNKGGRIKVISYPMVKELINEFKLYDDFSVIDGEENDIDIAFYNNNELVFWVLGHEDLWMLEEGYVEKYKNFVL